MDEQENITYIEPAIGVIYEGIYPPEAAMWCNENNCYIKELEPMEGVRRFEIKEVPSETEEEKREKIARLQLTKADVLLALYADKGLTPNDIKAMLQDNIPALIRFDYASSYYRGDEVVIALGTTLGYTSDDMDYLFLNKKFPTTPVAYSFTPQNSLSEDETGNGVTNVQMD